MGDTTKRRSLAILAIVITAIGTTFSVLAVQGSMAKDRTDMAVGYAVIDTTNTVTIKEHSGKLALHDKMFLKSAENLNKFKDENAKEHKAIGDALSLHRQDQTVIKQSQLLFEKTLERMESTQKEFQTEMRSDIKMLIQETAGTNAWIKNIEK
ncbi:hypothetical protein KAR91_18760 [Candidatus Pacearchaeota archaeon]|nr:hypothetical protein [Candidatus Pacearchaeota archaeon]